MGHDPTLSASSASRSHLSIIAGGGGPYMYNASLLIFVVVRYYHRLVLLRAVRSAPKPYGLDGAYAVTHVIPWLGDLSQKHEQAVLVNLLQANNVLVIKLISRSDFIL